MAPPAPDTDCNIYGMTLFVNNKNQNNRLNFHGEGPGAKKPAGAGPAGRLRKVFPHEIHIGNLEFFSI